MQFPISNEFKIARASSVKKSGSMFGCIIDRVVRRSQDVCWAICTTSLKRTKKRFGKSFVGVHLTLGYDFMCPETDFTKEKKFIIAKNCLPTLVKSRLALGSPGWSFATMPKMAQYTGKWLLPAPLWSHPKWNSFSDQTIPRKRNEWSSQSLE